MLSISKDSDRRGGYLLRAECDVPCSLDEVFAFFSDARQLETLTPPWLNFQVLTPAPIEMRTGLLLDYQLRIRGIPLRWQSNIALWDPPRQFVDVQICGPYRWWHHTHRFALVEGGTRVIDEVSYAVPGGELAHQFVVRHDLRSIFGYRLEKLRDIFGGV